VWRQSLSRKEKYTLEWREAVWASSAYGRWGKVVNTNALVSESEQSGSKVLVRLEQLSEEK
jgi:hypothetical protein